MFVCVCVYYMSDFLLHHSLQSLLLLDVQVELLLFQTLDICEVFIFAHHLLDLTTQETRFSRRCLLDFNTAL